MYALCPPKIGCKYCNSSVERGGRSHSLCCLSSDGWDSLLVEHQPKDRKVSSGGRIFFSRNNFVVLTHIWCPFDPMLLQWRMKDPCHSAKCAGGRLHLNTHTLPKHTYTLDPGKSEWTDYAVKAQCGNLPGEQAHTQLIQDTQPQSFQLTELLWTDSGLKSGKKKGAGGE